MTAGGKQNGYTHHPRLCRPSLSVGYGLAVATGTLGEEAHVSEGIQLHHEQGGFGLIDCPEQDTKRLIFYFTVHLVRAIM